MLETVLVNELPKGWGNRHSGPVGIRTPIYEGHSNGIKLTPEQIRDAIVTGGLRSYDQVVEAGYVPK